jgi:hypothetical protein
MERRLPGLLSGKPRVKNLVGSVKPTQAHIRERNSTPWTWTCLLFFKNGIEEFLHIGPGLFIRLFVICQR